MCRFRKKVTMMVLMFAAMSLLLAGCGKKEETPVDSSKLRTEEKAATENKTNETEAKAETPAKVEEPVAEAPAKTEEPAAEAPAKAEEPAAEEPAKAEEPAAEEPAAEQPAAQPAATTANEYPEEYKDYEQYYGAPYRGYYKEMKNGGKLSQITYHSSVVDADKTAQIYKPKGYPASGPYPLVLMIHGFNCDENQWTSMGACALLDNLINEGIIKPCIAVFPSVTPAGGLKDGQDSGERIQAYTDFITEWENDLLPYLLAKNPIIADRDAHAIVGLSMGGFEALKLGFTYLDYFNYIGSFSAAPGLDLSLLKPETEELKPELVMVCTGDKDNMVGDNPRNYYNAVVENGINAIFYLHPGEGHSPAVWTCGLYNFLTRLGGAFK